MNLSESRNVIIAFRTSEEFASWLKEHAESSGLSVSDYIRFVLEGHKWASEMVDKVGHQQTE